MSNLIFIKDNDNNVGIGSNMINDIKGNINITQNLNIEQNLNIFCKTGGSKLKIINDSESYAGIGWFRDQDEAMTEGNYRGYIQLNKDNSNMNLKALGDINLYAGDNDIKLESNKVCFTKNSGSYGPFLGIGNDTPEYPIHIKNGTRGDMDNENILYYIQISSPLIHGSNSQWAVSLQAKFEQSIWVSDYIVRSSDSRIKTNITDVPDNLALQQLRNIPCRYYEYIDKIERGSDKTIGFIAQEVKSVFPMAVSEQKQIIPNVYKIINCTWTSINGKFSMRSSDLPNVSGIIYKFYVSNATDGNDEKEIILTGNNDNTFTFDTQYTHVFCYGSEVNDFHTLDKDKLFTLNFSATQEIDRIQQTHITEIASLKAENTELKTKLNELTNKIKNATTFEDLKNSL